MLNCFKYLPVFYEIEAVFGLQNISFVAIILIVIEVW